MNSSSDIPLDWNFVCLLDTIACNINEEQFSDLKRKLKGMCSFTDAAVQRANSMAELFDELRDRQFLDRNNLDFLFRILQEIGNPDLLIQTMNYTKRYGQEIRFQRVLNEAPEKGFAYVTIYVNWKDAGTFDMVFLNDFKAQMSSFLALPQMHCFITGIEPTSVLSNEDEIKITLMLPQLYVEVLEKWMTENTEEKLQKLRIASIKTRDKIFKIEGLRDKASDDDSPFIAMARLYENLQERERDLNRTEELVQAQIDQLGKINCLPERLSKLHQKSGMSITLWKTLVKSRNGKIASHCIPQPSHSDIEKQSLHSKIARIYPQIKEQSCKSINSHNNRHEKNNS